MFIDYHVHPGYSIDAEPHDIREYCRRATEIGIEEICFTPHLEVDPKRKHIDWLIRVNGQIQAMHASNWLDHFFRDIQDARREFQYIVRVKAGLEVGYEPGQEEVIANILHNYPFDFVLGSIHCLEHVAISSKKECHLYFRGKEATQVCKDYYSLMDKAVKSGLFDCIAHLDLYRRYGKDYFAGQIETAHIGYVETVLRNMAAGNMGLEINTSSKRRGLKEFHPSKLLMQMAVDAGIRYFTVGSDAHRIGELGYEIKEAVNFLKDYDFEPSRYVLRRPVEQTGENRK